MKNKSLKYEIDKLLEKYETISLGELAEANLMDRKEVKYVLSEKQLPELISAVQEHYKVLSINDKQLFNYNSQYFDTDELNFFHDHRRGRLNRYKVRKRHYIDSDLSFFEVKFKNNHGRTRKSRIVSDPQKTDGIQKTEDNFLQEVSPFAGDALFPTVQVNYKRLTLVSKTTVERITIDINLSVQKGEESLAFEGLVIVEVKQDKLRNSPVKNTLKNMGIRSGTISKYCLGIISLENDIRFNRLKPAFDRLYKPFLTANR